MDARKQLLAVIALVGASSASRAQPASTSVGPGRIICPGTTSCELGIGTPPSLRYKVDPSLLAAVDKDRLKQCTAKATPCIATVTGSETPAGMKAASIKFYN